MDYLQLSIFLTLLSSLVYLSSGQSNWCYYGTCDPSTWTGLCANGLSQSPINIDPDNVTKTAAGKNLLFSGAFYDNNDFTMFNTHNFLVLRQQPQNATASRIQVKGAGFNGTYGFYALRFHWASEHMIKGRRYPLEMEIYFEQRVAPQNMGIISIIFALGKTDNKALAPIVSALPKVTNANTQVALPSGFNISAVLPPKVWDIFRYQGSDTTPPCQESTLWTIFTQRMPISQAQLTAFQSVQLQGQPAGTTASKNNRPIQTTYTAERKRIFWIPIKREKMIQAVFQQR